MEYTVIVSCVVCGCSITHNFIVDQFNDFPNFEDHDYNRCDNCAWEESEAEY